MNIWEIIILYEFFWCALKLFRWLLICIRWSSLIWFVLRLLQVFIILVWWGRTQRMCFLTWTHHGSSNILFTILRMYTCPYISWMTTGVVRNSLLIFKSVIVWSNCHWRPWRSDLTNLWRWCITQYISWFLLEIWRIYLMGRFFYFHISSFFIVLNLMTVIIRRPFSSNVLRRISKFMIWFRRTRWYVDVLRL